MSNSNKKAITIGMILGLSVLVCLIIVVLGYSAISSGSLFPKEIIDPEGNFDEEEEEGSGPTDGSEVSPSPLPSIGKGTYRLAECPFPKDYEGVECGYLTVPENRRDPNSPLIELAVAIVKSKNGEANIPLIYLEGGPGGSALDGVKLWLDTPIGFERDIILIDQRGTGYSKPTLNCSEFDDEGADEYSYEYDYKLIADCRDRLISEGIDLDMYNSAESAADIADLRIAMGYSQVDLFGISYGTRLALTVMRDYPEGIRSVILDSVYPPHVNALEEQSLIAVQVFEILFRGCEADPKCNQAYPDLETVFYELLTDFYDYPAEFSYYDEYYGEWVDETLYGDDIVNILFQSMYDSSVIPYLPAFLYALYNEDYDYAYEILDTPYAELGYDEEDYSEDYEDVSDSEGMFYAVECREEVYFNDVNTAEDLVDNYSDVITDGLLWEVDDFFETCDLWGIHLAPSIENMPVTSSIPTLVLAGEYDPITPPSWAQSTASYLENSQFFVFPGYGHAVIDGGPCPVAILLDFLDDPFSQVDDSCLAEIGPPDFVVNP